MTSISAASRGMTCVLLLAAAELRGDHWPQWRGPHGDSVSRESSVPLKWSGTESVLWRTALPEWGTSTPAIWGDAIFVTTHDEQDGGRLLVLRIDRASGKIVWTRQVGQGVANRKSAQTKGAGHRSAQKFHDLHNLASPSPVTDGESVFVHFGNGDLAAYDFDGSLKWRHNLQDEHGKYTIWWGHANSPVLAGELLVSVCMQDSLIDLGMDAAPSYLVAHDKRTGEQRWKTMRMTNAKAEECDSYITPVMRQTPTRQEMILIGGDQMDAYDPATGRQLWFLPGLAKSRIITGPTLAGDRVFATLGMRGAMLAVPLGAPDRPIRGERSASDIAWKIDKSTPDSCSPVVVGELLFAISDNGIAQCIDTRSGEVKWQERLPGDYKASPLAADGRVYFLSRTGLCTVVAASAEFKKLAENQLDDETIASPAVSEGRIYLRGRKALYCIGTATSTR